MKLFEFKKIIDKAFKRGNPESEVEIWVTKKKAHEVGRISQSGFDGTLYISVGAKIYDYDEVTNKG